MYVMYQSSMHVCNVERKLINSSYFSVFIFSSFVAVRIMKSNNSHFKKKIGSSPTNTINTCTCVHTYVCLKRRLVLRKRECFVAMLEKGTNQPKNFIYIHTRQLRFIKSSSLKTRYVPPSSNFCFPVQSSGLRRLST
jgi:hypothetical protein